MIQQRDNATKQTPLIIIHNYELSTNLCCELKKLQYSRRTNTVLLQVLLVLR
jgi:hypothetical protein